MGFAEDRRAVIAAVAGVAGVKVAEREVDGGVVLVEVTGVGRAVQGQPPLEDRLTLLRERLAAAGLYSSGGGGPWIARLYAKRTPMGCGCKDKVERLRTQLPVRGGRPRLALTPRTRVALGAGVEVLERLPVGGAEGESIGSGRPKANTSVMWQYFTTSVYRSGDLPVLAVRETLQNSVDAIDNAVAHRQIRRQDAMFSVEWDRDAHTLTVEDNGIGMDAAMFFDKFLSIGDTGKRDAASSAAGAGGKGGFGVAKAVILGTSTTFRWRMHTRDNLFVADGFDNDVKQYKAEFRQGTALVLYDVDPRFDERYDAAAGTTLRVEERIRRILAFNDLTDDLTIWFQGKVVPPAFNRRAGGKVGNLSERWGPATTAKVKAYRRNDKSGAYYVRLGGLIQFVAPSQRHTVKSDIVIDLHTSARPGTRDYPVNAARDGFTEQSGEAFLDLVAEVEQEDQSLGASDEYEVFDPDSDDEDLAAGGDEIALQMQEAMNGPEVRAAVLDAMGGIAEYYGEQAKYEAKAKRQEAESGAPRGTTDREKFDPDEGRERVVLPEGFRTTAEVAVVSGHSEADADGWASPGQAEGIAAALIGKVRGVLRVADNVRAGHGEAGSGLVLTSSVERALEDAERHGFASEDVVYQIERALNEAGDVAMSSGGGGLVQVAEVSAAFAALGGMVSERQAAELRRRNPFGKHAGLRISRKNYKRDRAYRFRKNYGRWVPYLVAWDSVLRLIAHEARIRRAFKPGFVLDDEVAGMAATAADGRAVVYVHPDRFAAAVKAHRNRPIALAAYVHGIAVHELAHLVRGMIKPGDGHSEAFVTEREDLGAATAHLLPAIGVLVGRLLRLPPPAEQRTITQLTERLAATRAELLDARKALRAAAGAGASRSRRSPAGAPSRPGDRAETVLDLVAGRMSATPPAGIDSEYVTGFFERHRTALLVTLRNALEGHRG